MQTYIVRYRVVYKRIVLLMTRALEEDNKMEDTCFVLVYGKALRENVLSYS
jgi:hypothetical protein